MQTDCGESKYVDPAVDPHAPLTNPELQRSSTDIFGGIDRTSNTFVGTPLYISPEMESHSITSPSNDLWALGIIIYEMLVGKTPFIAQNAEEVYDKIQNLDYTIPEGVDPEAADLITRLLKVDPRERLGIGTAGGKLVDYEALKAHPFLNGVDYEGLDSVEVPFPDDLFATYKTSLKKKLQDINSDIMLSALEEENTQADMLA